MNDLTGVKVLKGERVLFNAFSVMTVVHNTGVQTEIVHRHSRICLADIQPSFKDLELVDELKLFGIALYDKLIFNKHVGMLFFCFEYNQRFCYFQVTKVCRLSCSIIFT
jgi:hypothetical protein